MTLDRVQGKLKGERPWIESRVTERGLGLALLRHSSPRGGIQSGEKEKIWTPAYAGVTEGERPWIKSRAG